MILANKQIEIIDYVKEYLKKIEKKNIITSLSGMCYFPTWSETPGYAKIKFWLYGKFFLFKFLYIILKNILSIASHSKYLEFNDSDSQEKYNTLVLSWAFKENFKSDGSFQDKYFCENSKNLPNSKWLLISVDGYIPSNLNKNITLIKQKKTFFKYNFFFIVKILISLIIDYRFSFKKIIHYFSYHSYFAKKISKIVLKILKKNNFKNFLMPYEAQPFHQFAIYEAKKFDKKIITIGYIHSMLPAVPCDFIYRSGSPDILLVHGESQIEVLQSKLNWPKNKLCLIKSLRFRVDSTRQLSKKIYLPYIINNKNFILNNFEKLLKMSPINNFPKLDIKIHAIMKNSKKHLFFKSELDAIIEIYKNRFSDNPLHKDISIFFGVTSAIFEALESGTKVIHICSDPLFQSFNEEIWPNLQTKKINDSVYSYDLISSRKYINIGEKEITLDNILKNIIL